MDGDVTREWLESLGLANGSNSRDMLRYEITSGIRIIFDACVGGWSKPYLMTGSNGYIPITSRNQIECLLLGLGK